MKPAYLYAKITEDKHISLKWKWYGSTNDVTGFKIERRSADVADFTIIASTADYFFIDDKIPEGKNGSFIYRVHAFKGSVVSGYSNEIRVDIGPGKIVVNPEETATHEDGQIKPTIGPEATAGKIINPGPTSTPIRKTEPGTVWFVPDSLQVQTGTHFTTGIHINSGKQKVAAFGIVVEFSDAQLDVNRNIGNNGVIPGSDGFVAAVNARDPGVLFISGFDTFGKGPGDDLHLFTIQWRALTNGKTNLKLTIRNLNDDKTSPIRNLKTLDCKLSIMDKESVPGPEIVYYDEKWNTEQYNNPGTGRIEDNSFGNNNQPGSFNEGNAFLPDTDNQPDYNQPDNNYQPENNYQQENYNQPDYYQPDYVQPDNYNNGDENPQPETVTGAPEAHVTSAPDPTDIPTGKPTQASARTNAPTVPPASKKTAAPTATPRKTSAPTATPRKTAPPAKSGAGEVWLEPEFQTVHPGSPFETEVHVNTGSQRLATYGINFNFNRDFINIDKTIGKNGVTEGLDGFIAAANADNPGVLRVAGFDTSGKGPKADLHLITVHWRAVSTGKTTIMVTVKILTDDETVPIGTPTGKNGDIIIE